MSMNILIVEDSPICYELMALVLEGRGYHVQCAADAAEAMTAIGVLAPDLLLLDLDLPRESGLQFLRRLRSDKRWQDLPVIILSDNQSRHLVMHARELGARGYLLKSEFSIVRTTTLIEQCRNRNAVS